MELEGIGGFSWLAGLGCEVLRCGWWMIGDALCLARIESEGSISLQ